MLRWMQTRCTLPRPALHGACRHQRGQSLVEFALILPVLMLILMGIVQMGFVFNAYVTISNATREAARTATIYLYDRNLSAGDNDTARNEAARSALDSAMGMLSATSPWFINSSTWTITDAGDTFTTGDLGIAYTLPAGVTDTDSRAGQRVSVSMTYHLDLLIPFIGAILPHDANGRLPLTAQVSMLVN
jgi:Flp pilus assembly protein TadG